MSKHSVVFLVGILLVVSLLAGPQVNPVAGRIAVPAVDASVTLTAVADTMLNSAAPGTNYGSLSDFQVAYAPAGEQVALVRFDLSALPAGAIVDSATLRLYQIDATGATPVNVSVYPVTSSWDESTVTWATPLTTELFGLVASLDSTLGVYKTWDVTTYAQSWVDAPAGNHGLLIRGPFSGADYARAFESRELAGHVPQLAITYHLPPPDIVMEMLVASPDLAYPDEPVHLTAQLRNDGPGAVSDVPVRFMAGEQVLGSLSLASIAEGATQTVTLTHVFATTGFLDVVAEANPDHLIAESNYANNAASASVQVTAEKDAPFARPELVLSDLAFTPERPDPGESVLIEAVLENLSENPVPSTSVALWIDDAVMAELPLSDIEAFEARPIALTWPAALSGRHLVQLVADPQGQLSERNRDNNRLDGWIRVSGAPDPQPDLAVTRISSDLPGLNTGDSTTIAVEVCNRGYAGAVQVPVLISLDGHELGAPVIPSLPQDACRTVTARWEDAIEGQHVLDAWVDPQNQVPDDSVAARLAVPVSVTGPQYALTGGAAFHWQSVGPDRMTPAGNVGRIDDIAISHQDPQRMVVGAPAGGVWLTNDGGQTWAPIADHLESPNFSSVAFDPQNDNVIYAGTGSSFYGGGTGLYKTTDSGGHWTKFAGTGVATGYGPLMLTYTHPNTLTIIAATNTGIWLWEGPPSATTSTSGGLRFTNVWSQTVAGASSNVADLVLTSETTPRLYASVRGDSVYSATLSNPTTWTRIHAGLPAGTGMNAPGTATLATSPAAPGRIYAALKRPNSDLEIYRLDPGSATWAPRIASQSTFGPGNRFNAFIAAHPTDPGVLYVAGVRAIASRTMATTRLTPSRGEPFPNRISGRCTTTTRPMPSIPARPTLSSLSPTAVSTAVTTTLPRCRAWRSTTG